MKDLQRIGVKFFASDPSSIRVREFVPIFHSWIQKQCVPDHLLIDVHDYSHIQNGPGILLVAHEGNFSTDLDGGRMGLAYYRKQTVAGSLDERLAAMLKTAIHACTLLESEPTLDGRLRFRTDEILLVANDRLLAPNDAASVTDLLPAVSSVLAGFTATPASDNPKERFAVRLHNKESRSVRELLNQLSK